MTNEALLRQAAELVAIEDHGDGWCNIHVTLRGREGGDHTPETLYLQSDHPLVRLLRAVLPRLGPAFRQ